MYYEIVIASIVWFCISAITVSIVLLQPRAVLCSDPTICTAAENQTLLLIRNYCETYDPNVLGQYYNTLSYFSFHSVALFMSAQYATQFKKLNVLFAFYILVVILLGSFGIALHATFTVWGLQLQQVSLMMYYALLPGIMLTLLNFKHKLVVSLLLTAALEGFAISSVFWIPVNVSDTGQFWLQVGLVLLALMPFSCVVGFHWERHYFRYTTLFFYFMFFYYLIGIYSYRTSCDPTSLTQPAAMNNVLFSFMNLFVWNFATAVCEDKASARTYIKV
jgi:hypothetical protein